MNRTVIGDRPTTVRVSGIDTRTIPIEWTIYNAPRPLYGSICWQGDFCKGVFYAAVDPADPDAAWMVRRNEELDADVLHYVTEEQAFQGGRARYQAMPGRKRDEIMTVVDDPKNRSWVVQRYLDAVNRGEEI